MKVAVVRKVGGQEQKSCQNKAEVEVMLVFDDK